MNELKVKKILKNALNFSEKDINKLDYLRKSLLKYNSKYNLISKSTERSIWSRHILDSAQLTKYFDTNHNSNLADLGSGAGFPGLVIAIFNKNPKFHVKLYEKSKIKCKFLSSIKQKISIEFSLYENDYQSHKIESSYIVCRAFKKLPKILEISREKASKPHKLIILKGKNAQSEINNVSLGTNYSYKFKNSITDQDSKIILVEAK